MDSDLKPHDGGRMWWRERELWLLLMLLGGMYLTNLDGITIRGEESRRGRIAWEMLQSGNWVVPTMQDRPVFYRPPLQNALIASVAAVHGKVDAWSLRLPSVAAVLLTVVMIYGYGRSFLSKLGAFAAALGFASMGQVLELGRLGETEAVFTLFVAGSLLNWRWCLNRQTSPWLMWTSSYALAAAATLTKGPQAPMYFVGGVWLFLLVTRRWRMLCTLPHLAGIAVALSVLAVWQIPYAMQMGLEQSFKVYVGDVASRFGDMRAMTVIKHLVSFPLEIVFGSLLPWSLLLLCYANRRFRQDLGRLREDVLFLFVCIGISFPSVWIPATASLRYYMPMFPIFACLAGIAIERIAAYAPDSAWSTLFVRYQRTLASIALGTGTVILVASIGWPNLTMSQSIPFAVGYFLACLALAVVGWWAARRLSPRGIMIGMTSTACFLGLTYSTQLVYVRQKISEDAPNAIARLRDQLPDEKPLVSVGPAHHLFLLLYGEPVVQLPVDRPNLDQVGTDYFCFWVWSGGVKPADIPFEWEQVAMISCDRNRSPRRIDTMIVGRRVRSTQVANRPE
ncbi:MAG: glycosyltransferase family 39 protein [Planctomycetes bacterium]|nr:glycosyltransferase family 39 protein [Planctomycetota bacterium]